MTHVTAGARTSPSRNDRNVLLSGSGSGPSGIGGDNSQTTDTAGGTDGATGGKSAGIGLANCRGGGIVKARSGDWTAGDKGHTMGEGEGQGAGSTRSADRAAARVGDGPGEAGGCMGEAFAIHAAAVGTGPSCES